MNAEQHIAEAERYLEYACAETGRDHAKGAMYATIATAHATIAQAKKQETKR